MQNARFTQTKNTIKLENLKLYGPFQIAYVYLSML